MPATDSQLLYGLGPFAGMRPGRPGVFVPVRPQTQDVTTVTMLSNADTHRFNYSLTSSAGRLAFIEFPNLSNIRCLLRYDVGPNQPLFIGRDWGGRIQYYDVLNNRFVDLGPGPSRFTMGVQDDGNMYLNDGTQFTIDADGLTLQLSQWQYPAFQGTPILQKVPTAAPGLAVQEYFYAFTVITTIQTLQGPVKQESAPIGALAPFPYHKTIMQSDVPAAVQISGLGGGIDGDGNSYAIGIYRLSQNQPNWFQLVVTQAGTYVDTATDQSISGNQQLAYSGQPPPLEPNQLWPIAEYLDRMWIFAIVQNKATNGLPQTQMWYSNVGQGWNFDYVNQVLPVGNEATTPDQSKGFAQPPTYGAEPVALIKFGSLLVGFRQNDSWFVTGQDQNTFQVIPLFDTVGCIAQFGPVTGRGILAWPATSGYWSWDGANLNYISDDIFELLQTINPADAGQQVGFYWNNFFCWSYPTLGYTLRWHAPTNTWDQLSYAMQTAPAATRVVGNNPLAPTTSPPYNQVIGVRSLGESFIDSWFADPSNDLGVTAVAAANGPYSDLGLPGSTQTVRWIVLHGPPQPGATATVTLHRDYDNLAPITMPADPGTGAPLAPFDLGSDYPWIIQVPDGYSQCTAMALNVQITANPTGTAPIQLWKCEAYGQISRDMAIKV